MIFTHASLFSYRLKVKIYVFLNITRVLSVLKWIYSGKLCGDPSCPSNLLCTTDMNRKWGLMKLLIKKTMTFRKKVCKQLPRKCYMFQGPKVVYQLFSLKQVIRAKVWIRWEATVSWLLPIQFVTALMLLQKRALVKYLHSLRLKEKNAPSSNKKQRPQKRRTKNAMIKLK